MKISERWLREWVNPALTREQLMAQLTMAGLEIEACDVLAPINNVVVAEVISAEKHPNADKLRVAQVFTGRETLQIVCGAANCRPGIKIPCALVGAKLPGGLEIKQAELRGVASSGMLCSAKELSLSEDSSGLLELAADAPIGVNISDYLSLDDAVLEVNLTPNRGDCLGVIGVARELAVLNKISLTASVVSPVNVSITSAPIIELQAPEACPRFVSRIITGIDRSIATPLWMQEKLRRSGVRSLGLIVDVTNYVMLELGQPMHAYDLRQIKGGIRVRYAQQNESLKLLDGRDIKLDADTLIIADHEKALGLAGIMGGEHSGVADDSRDVLLEVAFFQPIAIAGRARRYGLHTDASHRFERGVDPQMQAQAMERATQLLVDIGGGQAGPLIDAMSAKHMPQPATIALRRHRIERLLGVTFPDDEIVDILSRLGLRVSNTADGWLCVAPSHRFDIAIEEDLIEELVRVHGYNNLAPRTPQSDLRMVRLPETQTPVTKLRQLLCARGYQEVITFSFGEPKLMQKLQPQQQALPLMNPITPELAVMRTTLWAGLVSTAKHNLNRQATRLALFETGLRFDTTDGLKQDAVIAGLLHGTRATLQWNHGSEKYDFYDLKGDVEALLLAGGASNIAFERAAHPALHPGQCAQVIIDGRAVGILGALHPTLVSELDLPGDVFLFELLLAPLTQATLPRYTALSAYPSVARDLALVVDEDVEVEKLLTSIRKVAGEWLEELNVFDIYRGKGIDLGRKSVALGLTLRHPSRTLNDTEVATVMDTVVSTLSHSHAAQLRR